MRAVKLRALEAVRAKWNRGSPDQTADHPEIRTLCGSERAGQSLAATGIRPVVDRTFPLESIADAVRLRETGGHVGKIALEF